MAPANLPAGPGAGLAGAGANPAAEAAAATAASASAAARRRQRLALALLWITPALWSSNYLIARAAVDVVAPHALALGRWALVLALLLPQVWPERAAIAQALRAEWRQALVLGALGMWVCGAFVYIGARSTTALNIGLIYAAAPVGIAVVGSWLLGERLPLRRQAGMGLALLGVLIVIGKGRWQTLAAVSFSVGDLWILCAAVCWVAYSLLQQRWPSRLSARARLACMAAGGIAVLLPFTALEAALQPWPPLSGRAVGLVLLAGLLPGLFSYSAYTYLVRELGASRASVIMYLAPLYAALTAWVLLGEAPQWFHALGAALILPSVHLATSAPAPAPAAASAPPSGSAAAPAPRG